MSSYRKLVSPKARRAECDRVCAENPDQLPIVVESASSSHVHFVAVPRTATVAELSAAVRAALGTSSVKPALVIEGCSPAVTTAVGDIFDACKHADGFLYVACAREAKLGAQQICCTNTGSYLKDIENNPDIMGGL